jgi:hypothetical protein
MEEIISPILSTRVFFQLEKKIHLQKNTNFKVWELYFSASSKILDDGKNNFPHTLIISHKE